MAQEHFSTSESEEEVVTEMIDGDITKMMSTMPAQWSSTEDELDFAESSAGEEEEEPFEMPVLESKQTSNDFAESSVPEQTSNDFAESSAPEQTSNDFAESSAVDTHSETSETPSLSESIEVDSMSFDAIAPTKVVSSLEFADSSAPEQTSNDFAESSGPEQASNDFAESSAPEQTSSGVEFAESSAPEQTSSGVDFAESSAPEGTDLDFAESSAAETETSENEM